MADAAGRSKEAADAGVREAEETLAVAFRRADIDGSGAISPAEFAQILTTRGLVGWVVGLVDDG